MKRTPQRQDGYGLEAADVAEERARVYQLTVTTLCGVCPDWSFVGSSEDGSRAFTEHKNQTHPDAQDRGQKARRRAAGRSSRPRDAR